MVGSNVTWFQKWNRAFITIDQDSMIRAFAIIFGCLAVGELVVALTGLRFPSSILGMLLLTVLLKIGWIKLKWVRGSSDFLVGNLGFFFVPAGVAIMAYYDLLKAQWLPILVSLVVSTVLVILTTGWVHQLVRRSK